MDEWFLPHMAMGFACWDLTNNAVSLLTVYPKKPVPYGWFVLCTLTMMWSWQQSSLQHIVRLPQGALVDGSLCISQSFRHNLHQIRNSSGVWLINYFNLGEVFSFLEDHISLGHCGSVNINTTRVLGVQRHPTSPFRLHSVVLSAFLCSCLCRWAWVFLAILHVALVFSPIPVSTIPPCLPSFLILVWILWTFCRSFGWDEKTQDTNIK